jgi:Holliday junction resolvase RusA-like endonuclease
MPALPKFNSAAASAADTAVAASTSSPERRGGQPSAPFHAPDEVVICLPIPPTTNNLFAGTGKRRYRTSEYNSWIEEAGWQIATQKPPQVYGRVSLTIEVREPKSLHRMDLANREKATVDLLVKHLVIQGDSQFYVRELNMRWADIQGVRVTIRPLASESGVAG